MIILLPFVDGVIFVVDLPSALGRFCKMPEA